MIDRSAAENDRGAARGHGGKSINSARDGTNYVGLEIFEELTCLTGVKPVSPP